MNKNILDWLRVVCGQLELDWGWWMTNNNHFGNLKSKWSRHFPHFSWHEFLNSSITARKVTFLIKHIVEQKRSSPKKRPYFQYKYTHWLNKINLFLFLNFSVPAPSKENPFKWRPQLFSLDGFEAEDSLDEVINSLYTNSNLQFDFFSLPQCSL